MVFADLVGFTGLSETRDPERVKNLVDRCFQRLAHDVTSYGGRVDNVVGDAIVALFGAPVAHEDDAERAVRAALQMQETVAGMGSELSTDVLLRVGVNTGVVLVGAVRGGGDYTAMGDVVNVASRLQVMAEPGQVIVGPLTHAATQQVVQYEPLGPVQARGREEPVDAWVAQGCLARPGSRPHRAETPLVGREAELGLLAHALDTATSRRRAQLILLLGEAGVGKSRLAEAVACRAREEHEAVVLEGRCVPYGEANVWWPVAEAIREAAGIADDDPADVLAAKCRGAVASATGTDPDSPEAERLTDGLLYLMGDQEALADVDPQRARDEARRSLQAFVEGLARRQPVVIVLSELHWAHEWVLEGIDRLLERLRHVPVVIVCTARPELEARWAYQPSHRNLVLLHVDPLDELESARLLGSLLGREPPAEMRELLLERSGGNPLFLEELVGLLGEEAVLAGWDGERGAATRSSELPATLRGLVAARLDALSTAEREALEDAAVVGRTGSLDALVALVKARGETGVAAVFDQLAAKDLLAFEPVGEWEFRSALVREVAYETLTKAERARRHARLAEWIGGRVKETGREDEVLEQLAHHYGAAAELVSEVGQVEGVRDDLGTVALGAVYKAAHRALDRDLYRVSISLFNVAFRLLGPGPGVARRRLLLERASAHTAVRDLAGARVDIDAVLEEAIAVEDPHSEAKALNELGRIQQAEGSYTASAATLDRALELWDRVGYAKGRAQALSERGMTRLHSGDPDSATVDLREALAAFQALGNRKGEAWAQWNLAYISFARGHTGEAEEHLSRAARAFEEAGDYGGLDWVKGLLGYVRNSQGRRAEAEELATQIVDDARERGDRWALAVVLMLISTVRQWEGRTEEAIEPGREALALFRSFNDRVWELRALWPLCRALAGAGHVEEAVALADEALAGADEGTRPELYADAAAASVSVALHLGEPARALEVLRDVEATLVHYGADWSAKYGLVFLQTGRPVEAAEHLDSAMRETNEPGPRANALALLALAAAEMGSSDEALAHAQEALGVGEATYNDRTMALLARAFALLQLGRSQEAVDAMDRSGHEAAATGDRVLQAHVLVARGRMLEALGDPSAAEVIDAAGACRAGLGIDGGGWDTLFRLAAAEHRAAAAT